MFILQIQINYVFCRYILLGLRFACTMSCGIIVFIDSSSATNQI